MFTSSSDQLVSLRAQTLTAALDSAPPNKTFATIWNDEESSESVTFGEFRELARKQASTLHEQGLRKGETVVLILPQGIPLMSVFAGAMSLGAVPTILAYPNFKVEPKKYGSGLAGVTANLKATLVVVDQDFPAEWLSIIDANEGTRIVRCGDRHDDDPNLSNLSFGREEATDLAFIQHSAGTTGLQKGVALSHEAVLRQLEHLVRVLRITEKDSIYSWLPLYHDMGLIACFILPMVYHLSVVMQSPTDWVMQPGTMLQLITEHRCTLAWTPNFALQFLARRVRRADREGLDLSSMRALINCSEPIRAQSMDEFSQAYSAFGLQPTALQNSYAMAENVFAVTQSAIDSQPKRLWVDGSRLREEYIASEVKADKPGAMCIVSSGTCLPGNSIRIVSTEGNGLADGAVGEILIQSDSLFSGYYNRRDLTAEVLVDSWFKSGDLGFCLQGELFVVGRKKDLIIVGGKNIYPHDVEELAGKHPAIHDGRSIALGILNAELGTEEIVVVSEVEREELLADAREIERWVRNEIVAELGVAVRAVYLKPPRWIVKSTAGKSARSSTRQKLLTEHPELVGKQNDLDLK